MEVAAGHRLTGCPLTARTDRSISATDACSTQGVTLWADERRVEACVSEDDGKTWNPVSEIPTRSGDDSSKYHELHAVEAADGRLIVQIRNHNSANSGETLQTHSTDGGKTWAEPHSIGVWGLPSHLLRLSDDRLLMTYGHRRAPLG